MGIPTEPFAAALSQATRLYAQADLFASRVATLLGVSEDVARSATATAHRFADWSAVLRAGHDAVPPERLWMAAFNSKTPPVARTPSTAAQMSMVDYRLANALNIDVHKAALANMHARGFDEGELKLTSHLSCLALRISPGGAHPHRASEFALNLFDPVARALLVYAEPGWGRSTLVSSMCQAHERLGGDVCHIRLSQQGLRGKPLRISSNDAAVSRVAATTADQLQQLSSVTLIDFEPTVEFGPALTGLVAQVAALARPYTVVVLDIPHLSVPDQHQQAFESSLRAVLDARCALIVSFGSCRETTVHSLERAMGQNLGGLIGKVDNSYCPFALEPALQPYLEQATMQRGAHASWVFAGGGLNTHTHPSFLDVQLSDLEPD